MNNLPIMSLLHLQLCFKSFVQNKIEIERIFDSFRVFQGHSNFCMIGITKDSLSVLSWNSQQICFSCEISGLDMSCACIHSKNTGQDKVEQTEEEKLRKAANCRRDKLRRCIYFGSETDEQRENR